MKNLNLRNPTGQKCEGVGHLRPSKLCLLNRRARCPNFRPFHSPTQVLRLVHAQTCYSYSPTLVFFNFNGRVCCTLSCLKRHVYSLKNFWNKLTIIWKSYNTKFNYPLVRPHLAKAKGPSFSAAKSAPPHGLVLAGVAKALEQYECGHTPFLIAPLDSIY